MEMPLELPKDLHYLNVAKDSTALMEMLSGLPSDLITFFEAACEDHPWCAIHSDFMKSCIRWITLRSFDEKLAETFVHRAATAIRKNYRFVQPYIFNNLIFEVAGAEIPQNSLLWATTSDYFHKHIRIECREKKSSTISMGNLTLEIFEQIREYVETGEVENLWRKSESEILEVFRDASEWDIPGLMMDCENLLKKYITPEDAIEKLITAHQNGWLHLKLTCMEFINGLNWGLRFETEDIQHLAVEILNFNRRTLEAFEPLSKVITHLYLGGTLAENSEFTPIIQSCKHLLGIGFGGSNAFSDKFLDIPSNIHDLDLSKCVWLNADYLKKFASVCPGIKSLNLENNYDLTYEDWGVINDFKVLDTLNISYCHQIQDEDFKIIIHACRSIKKLIMVESLQMNENMYIEMGRTMQGLTDLNISRSNISDTALVDLSTNCNDLVTLNLSRCLNITERGILEAINHFPSLRELNISNCRIPPVVLEAIKKKRPTLKLCV